MAGAGNDGNEDSQDPEAGWPPRFNDIFIAIAGFLVLAAAVAAALILRDVIAPETPTPTPKQTMAYVFAVAGLLMLLLGALFGLVEARRPPNVVVFQQAGDGTEFTNRYLLMNLQSAQGAQVVGAIVKVSGAISKEKRSTAAWSIGVGLLLLAGAVSGLVSLSVGEDDPAGEDPTEEATSEAPTDPGVTPPLQPAEPDASLTAEPTGAVATPTR